MEEAATPHAGSGSRIFTRINARLRDHEEGTDDDLVARIEGYGPEARDRLDRLLTFIEAQLLTPEHDGKD